MGVSATFTNDIKLALFCTLLALFFVEYNNTDESNILLCCLSTLIVIYPYNFLVRLIENENYRTFVQIVFYISFVPIVVFFSLFSEVSHLLKIIPIFTTFILVGLIKFKLSRIKGFPAHSKFVILATAVLCVSIYIFKDFNILFFYDPTSVYLYREENQTILDINLIKLYTWIIIPTLILSTNDKNRYVVLFMVIFSSVIFYGTFGHKSLLGLPVAIYFLYRSQNIEKFLLNLLLFLLMIGLFGYLANIRIIDGIFVRRVFYVPTYLAIEWLNAFEHSSVPFWGTVFPLNLFEYYPFHKPLIQIMSEKVGGWPNVGALVDLFVNANIIGWFFAWSLAMIIRILAGVMNKANGKVFCVTIAILYLNSGVAIYWFGFIFVIQLFILLLIRYGEG